MLIAAVAQSVRHSGGVHWGIVFVAFFTGATAIGGFALWRVSVRSHRLNEAVSGAGCPIVPGPTRVSWGYDGRQVPTPDARRSGSRALALRLRNVGTRKELVTLDAEHSRVWSIRGVTFHACAVEFTPHGKDADTHTFMIGLTRDTEWPRWGKAYVSLTFNTADASCEFHGWLRLWKL